MTVPRLTTLLSEAGFQDWANWALSQADRIDPVLPGSFRTVHVDDGGRPTAAYTGGVGGCCDGLVGCWSIPVSDRGTLEGLTQFEFAGSATSL